MARRVFKKMMGAAGAGAENTLAASIRFGPLNINNIGMLRALNQAIFPVKYNEKFYSDILATPIAYTKFGYLDGYVISAICCRPELIANTQESSTEQYELYIMTLGVLEPYRKQHIGTKLLAGVLDAAKHDLSINAIYLHVQTNNLVAIAFYKKFGFEVTETIPDYYKNISPSDCYVLKRRFNRQLG